MMYELKYELKDGCSAGFGATETLVESVDILKSNVESGRIDGNTKRVIIDFVKSPSMKWDNWGREIKI